MFSKHVYILPTLLITSSLSFGMELPRSHPLNSEGLKAIALDTVKKVGSESLRTIGESIVEGHVVTPEYNRVPCMDKAIFSGIIRGMGNIGTLIFRGDSTVHKVMASLVNFAIKPTL